MKFNKTLLEIAKKDLKAAKCLYEKELYPQAIFYLQQSVEKAAKSFAIMTNMIKEDEVKTVRHNPLKIQEKLLNEQKEKLERLNRAFDAIPRLTETSLLKNIDLDKMREALDKFQRSLSLIQAEPVFLSKQEITQFIEELDKSEKEVTSAFASSPPPDQEFINMLKQGILELLDILYEYNPQRAEELRKEVSALSPKLFGEIIEKIKPLMIDFLYVHLSLFYLSIITFPHAVIARYPNGRSNPLEIYKEDFPLTELFGECAEKMEKTLAKIENFENFAEEAAQVWKVELIL